MNFVDVIRKDLDQEANTQKIKLSVLLTGQAARKFQELHRTFNHRGQDIGASQLASRLLILALRSEPKRRRRSPDQAIGEFSSSESL
jgi:hypothetical protein